MPVYWLSLSFDFCIRWKWIRQYQSGIFFMVNSCFLVCIVLCVFILSFFKEIVILNWEERPHCEIYWKLIHIDRLWVSSRFQIVLAIVTVVKCFIQGFWSQGFQWKIILSYESGFSYSDSVNYLHLVFHPWLYFPLAGMPPKLPRISWGSWQRNSRISSAFRRVIFCRVIPPLQAFTPRSPPSVRETDRLISKILTTKQTVQ